MDEQLLDRRLASWLVDGSTKAPGWILESVVAHARANPRRARLRVRWSDAMKAVTVPRPAAAMRPILLLAVLALLVALTVVMYVGSHQPAILPVVPSPTASPSASLVPSTEPSPTRAAFICPPGTDPDLPARLPESWVDDYPPPMKSVYPAGMVFDASAGQIVALGGSMAWSFDVCTNSWADTGVALGGEPGFAVYDSANDQVFLGGMQSPLDPWPAAPFRPEGHWYKPDLAALVRVGDLPFDEEAVGKASYRDRSGETIVRAGTELWAYDAEIGQWQLLEQLGANPPNSRSWERVAYDGSVDRLILVHVDATMADDVQFEANTFEFDFATSSWTGYERPPQMPSVGAVGGPMAYDPVSQMTIMLAGESVLAYDANNHRWQTLFEDASRAADLPNPDWGTCTLVADSTNGRVVFLCPHIGGEGWSAVGLPGVFALDVLEGRWTTLVPVPPYPNFD